ncbi:MAG: hypothetical protein WDZ46_09180 [Solirubrobacterales bacterium]
MRALCRIALLAALCLALTAGAAQAAVQWHSQTWIRSTHLVPGQPGNLDVTVANVGDTASSTASNTVMEIELPPGVSRSGGIYEQEPWTCFGATTVTCISKTETRPYATPTQTSVVFAASLELAVSPGASGPGILRTRVSGGGAPAASLEERPVSFAPAPLGLGFAPGTLSAGMLDAGGQDYTQAGGHGHEAATAFELNLDGGAFNSGQPVVAGGRPKDIVVDLPPGFVGDPTAVTQCPHSAWRENEPGCPPESQVGVAYAFTPAVPDFQLSAVYNMVPPKNRPAQLAFRSPGGKVVIDPHVRPDGSISARVRQITEAGDLWASKVVLWGVPADASHDQQRCMDLNQTVWRCVGYDSEGNERLRHQPSSSLEPRRPFLTNPTRCAGPAPRSSFRIASWANPAADINDPSDPAWASATVVHPALSGCEALEFSPTLTARPTTNRAESPSGLDVRLGIPQNQDPDGLATAHLKDTTVTLPEGLTLNPAAANGLAACSGAEIGLQSPAGTVPPRFDEAQPRCPAAAKLADAKVTTPLLADPLSGEVYLAAQGDNPFASTYALYIVIRGPGILVKLAGKTSPDPASGRLTASFEQNPQLPFSELELDFFGGPRGPLATPPTCGTHTTASRLTPWSAPFSGPPAASTDAWQIAAGPGGGHCAGSDAELPFAPQLEAGTLAPLAGAHSPFALRLRRADGQREIEGLRVALPSGLVGSLSGVPACPEPSLAKFAGRANTPPGTAASEIATPSCPPASALGRVVIGAGAGPAPLHLSGQAYLAGPYKGAPLSLAAIVPAKAGPFDLGAVMVRSALHVDPRTAQITAISDPIPSVIEGTPVKLRDLRLLLDRPGFMLNPTSCEPMQIAAGVSGAGGAVAQLANRFQVAECAALGFKPRVALRLLGPTERGANPRLRAVVRPRSGDANIARTVVRMPRSAFLDQSHIRTICTRVQFAADACPPGSVYGRAIARTPLLDEPLAGNVYLRSSDNKLPDLVADLRGPAYRPIRVELVGRTDSVKGALRSSFDVVPDAPVSFFRLDLLGGKRGLIENSRNLCSGAQKAGLNLQAHNSRRLRKAQRIAVPRCKRQRRAKKRQAAKGKRAAQRRAAGKRG